MDLSGNKAGNAIINNHSEFSDELILSLFEKELWDDDEVKMAGRISIAILNDGDESFQGRLLKIFNGEDGAEKFKERIRQRFDR